MLLPPGPHSETPGVPVRAGVARPGEEEKWGRSEGDRPRTPLKDTVGEEKERTPLWSRGGKRD